MNGRVNKETMGSRHEYRLWKRAIAQIMRSRSAILGAIITFSIITTAILAPIIAPHDPNKQHLKDVSLPPVWDPKGTKEYILGTDHLGRDILSRILFGSRASLLVAIAAALIGAVIGCLLGIIAGFYGGVLETIIMRIVDIQLAFPMILLALALVAALGSSFRNLVVVMGITGWMSYARIMRGCTLSLKEREFLLAARSLGATNPRLMFRHILPNLYTPIIVLITLEIPRFILVESGLSFLGLGIPPHIPTWGRMLADARGYITVAYWMITFPGVAIMAAVLGINLFGDGLSDALDPRIHIR